MVSFAEISVTGCQKLLNLYPRRENFVINKLRGETPYRAGVNTGFNEFTLSCI